MYCPRLHFSMIRCSEEDVIRQSFVDLLLRLQSHFVQQSSPCQVWLSNRLCDLAAFCGRPISRRAHGQGRWPFVRLSITRCSARIRGSQDWTTKTHKLSWLPALTRSGCHQLSEIQVWLEWGVHPQQMLCSTTKKLQVAKHSCFNLPWCLPPLGSVVPRQRGITPHAQRHLPNTRLAAQVLVGVLVWTCLNHEAPSGVVGMGGPSGVHPQKQ